MRLQNEPLPEKLSLYNPMTKDFTVVYDSKGENPTTLTAKSLEISEFDYLMGVFVRDNLFNAVMNDRQLNPILPKNREDVMDMITP
jgi:hypothetical protein